MVIKKLQLCFTLFKYLEQKLTTKVAETHKIAD